MAINFPNSPSDGDIFGNYAYDISIPGWRKVPENAASLPAGTIVQWPGATAPANWLICDGAAISRTEYASLFAAIGVQYGAGNGTTTFNLPNLKGRVAVGFDASQSEFDVLGETGGAKTHTLTTSQMPSHTHVQDSHNHTQDSHNHTQNSHNHTQNAHSHTLLANSQVLGWSGVGGGGGIGAPTNAVANGSGGVTVGTSSVTPTNQATTATNNSTTATNQATTATNQNTGGGEAHNNLQPYIVLNYIIKTSAGITSGDSELATRVGATELEIDALQIAESTTNKSGLVPIIPSSVTVGAGSASVASDGEITFTNSRIISANLCFSSLFRNYLITFNITSASAASGLIVQFRTGTSTDVGTTYRYTYSEDTDAISNPASGGDNQNNIRFGRTDTSGSAGELTIYSPFDSSVGTRAIGTTFDFAYYGKGAGFYKTAKSHDGFTLHNNASITITGSMKIYGYR
jgi:microcystin-dependent protein